jgi:RimJ/RimL family protein N-acetyltransferase
VSGRSAAARGRRQGAGIERFRTGRLEAERVAPRHLPLLHALYGDPRVGATLGGATDLAGTRRRLRAFLADWETVGYGPWLFREAGGECAGVGGLRPVEVEGEAAVEVLYALRPAYWGRGLGSEMARAIVARARDPLGLGELVCFTLPDNRASRRVMEKVGFRYERDFVRRGLPHVLYRLPRPPTP